MLWVKDISRITIILDRTALYLTAPIRRERQRSTCLVVYDAYLVKFYDVSGWCILDLRLVFSLVSKTFGATMISQHFAFNYASTGSSCWKKVEGGGSS